MGLLSRLLKGASQEPFQTHVAFVFLLDDDAKEMMHALPGRQFTPDALLSCARLRIFQPTPANKSRIIDEAGSIYETFILPTKIYLNILGMFRFRFVIKIIVARNLLGFCRKWFALEIVSPMS